jgi:hypothetical protein
MPAARWTKIERSRFVRFYLHFLMRFKMINYRRSAAFSASSRLFDSIGEVGEARTTEIGAMTGPAHPIPPSHQLG